MHGSSRRVQLVTASLAALAVSAIGGSSMARQAGAKLPRGTIVRDAGGFGTISAYAGRIVWSHQDPNTDRWALMQYRNGRVSRVPLAQRDEPFDVDLGPGASGGTVAVYSRCTGQRRVGCDIYKFDFATGKETAVSAANTGRSEYEPSIWRTKLAFVRTCVWSGHGCRGAGKNGLLYLLDMSKAGSSKRISPRRRVGPDQFAVTTNAEVRGTHVAYSWDYGEGLQGKSELRLYDGRRSRVLYATSWGGAGGHAFEWPTFANRGTLYVVEQGIEGEDFSQIVRYSLATGKLEKTQEYGRRRYLTELEIAWLNGKLVRTDGDVIHTLATPRFHKVTRRR